MKIPNTISAATKAPPGTASPSTARRTASPRPALTAAAGAAVAASVFASLGAAPTSTPMLMGLKKKSAGTPRTPGGFWVFSSLASWRPGVSFRSVRLADHAVDQVVHLLELDVGLLA